LVRGVEEAVTAVGRVGEIDGRECRRHVEQHFSIQTMVRGYERVYQRIFELEAEKTRRLSY
jgi:hypothetical protein